MPDADASGLVAWVGDLVGVWMVLYGLGVVGVRVFGDLGRADLEELISGHDEERRKRELSRIERLMDTADWAWDAAVLLKAASAALLAVGWVLTGGLVGVGYLMATAVVGEIVLGGIFSSLSAEAAYHAGGALAFFLWPLSGLVWLRGSVARVVERVLGRAAPQEAHEELEDEVMAIVSEGERDGVIEEVDRDMIEGVFSIKDKDVAEIMTPRTDIVCVEAVATAEEARRLALSSGHSRIPVFQDTRDNIVGVLYVKDLLNYWNQDNREQLTVRDIMRQPVFIPEQRKVTGLLSEMQRQRSHLAIVIDEYGGTAGLVTIEDILEEFVGEIVDEYDRSEPPAYERISDSVYRVKARMHIDEFNEVLGVDLPEDQEFDTVGGYLASHLGYIPQPGEEVTENGIEFKIVKASERRVDMVDVRRFETEDAEG